MTRLLLLGFSLLFINDSFSQLGLYGALQVASNKVIALQDQPLYFFNGVIGSEGEDAQLLFLGSAQALNASEDAYSEIEVSIAAQDNFIFPLGNQGRYLPLQLSEGNATALQAQLKIGSPQNLTLATGIDQLIPSHHSSLVEKSTEAEKSSHYDQELLHLHPYKQGQNGALHRGDQ